MLHAQYGRWLLLGLVGSIGCTYDFGGATDGGGEGGASISGVFTSDVATSSEATNAGVDVSSATGINPDVLADCGFEDTFDTKDLWYASLADVVGGHAETMLGVVDVGYAEYDGGFASKQSFALNDCFLSLRVDTATAVGNSFLAIEDATNDARAIEIQIGSEREEAGTIVRGVRWVVYPGNDTMHASATARVERPTYLGLWIDGASQSMRVFVHDGASWIAIGSLPPAPYVGAARLGFGSFAWSNTPAEVASVFDDLNVLAVTRAELNNALPMIVLEEGGSSEQETGDD